MTAKAPRATFQRDADGFWVAYVEDGAQPPENRAVGTVRTRYTLPVPPSATCEEAAAAFRALMAREGRR